MKGYVIFGVATIGLWALVMAVNVGGFNAFGMLCSALGLAVACYQLGTERGA